MFGFVLLGFWLWLFWLERPGLAPWVIGLLLQLAVGTVALVLLPRALRSTNPAWSLAVLIAGFFSSLGAGACLVVLAVTGARRRWIPIIVSVVVFTVLAQLPRLLPGPAEDPDGSVWWAMTGLALAVSVITVLIGMYAGSRADLLASLRQEAYSVRREQQAVVARATAEERTRIAREMHDSLSHRLSLISLHAGAVAHRDDLDPGTVRDACATIADQAHVAATELRSVLSVLREDSAPHPQQGLADLDGLIAETTAAGTPVEAAIEVEADGLGDAVARHLYRIVQELLTNARKHAPGEPVRLRLSGSPADGVHLACRNRRTLPPRSHSPGTGLIGVRERVRACAGRMDVSEAADEFGVEVWLPA